MVDDPMDKHDFGPGDRVEALWNQQMPTRGTVVKVLPQGVLDVKFDYGIVINGCSYDIARFHFTNIRRLNALEQLADI